MKITGTQSITRIEYERSIMSLRFLKNYLHSCMGEAPLNVLAMLYIHRDFACDLDAFVGELERQNPQRLKLCNPLHTDEDDYALLALNIT